MQKTEANVAPALWPLLLLLSSDSGIQAHSFHPWAPARWPRDHLQATLPDGERAGKVVAWRRRLNAAVTNGRDLGSLKEQRWILLQSWRPQVQSQGVNAVDSSGGSERRHFPGPSPSFGAGREGFCVCWPLAFLTYRASLPSLPVCLRVCLSSPLLSYKDNCC